MHNFRIKTISTEYKLIYCAIHWIDKSKIKIDQLQIDMLIEKR